MQGSVTYIYLTHDAGARLRDFEYLVGNLTQHVKIVDANTLVDMAVAAEQQKYEGDQPSTLQYK